MSEKRESSVMRSEELDAAVDELLQLAQSEGKALRHRGPKGRVFITDRPDKPKIDELLRRTLRTALEDEVVPAVALPSGGSIDPAELHREVIKKALVTLKLSTLRQLARDRTLLSGGSLEAVAARVAEAYGWNEEEIARLVLANEEEPAVDSGHVDRIFPLADVLNIGNVRDLLSYVQGRYIRIGIARWFVFESIDEGEEDVKLRGTVRSYQASVDDTEELPTLSVVPSEHEVRVVLTQGSDVLRIRRASAASSRAAVRALEVATRLQVLGYVPVRGAALLGSAGFLLDSSSIFMLDLLNTRFREAGLRDLNLTICRFKLGDETAGSENDDERKPTLRAVRFEGTHLLDSVPACELLVNERRALVEISLRTRTSSHPDREPAQFPIHVGIESDHVVVATGFGTGQPELSLQIHRTAVAAVVREIQEGVADPGRLDELAQRISERAGGHSPDEADMLVDPQDQ